MPKTKESKSLEIPEQLSAEEQAKQIAEIEKLLREDSLAGTELDIQSIEIGGRLGVMQRIITAIMDDKEFRQILLLAAFDDKTEALLVADAIAERQRYGVEIAPILNRVIAQCAVKSGQVNRVLGAFTQRQLTTYNNPGKRGWRQSQETGPID